MGHRTRAAKAVEGKRINQSYSALEVTDLYRASELAGEVIDWAENVVSRSVWVRTNSDGRPARLPVALFTLACPRRDTYDGCSWRKLSIRGLGGMRNRWDIMDTQTNKTNVATCSTNVLQRVHHDNVLDLLGHTTTNL